MIYKLAKIWFLIGFISAINAQSSDYFSVKDVEKYRFDHLELNNENDVSYFLKNASKFNFIEALKINQTKQLPQIIEKLDDFYDLKILQLKDYSGDLTEATFANELPIEVLHLSVKEGELNQLIFLKKLSKLNQLFLYLEGRPDDFSSFKTINTLKELHLIADLLPVHIDAFLDAIQNQTQLQVLGLSLDRVTDLPKRITQFITLPKLIIYDNLSVFTNKGIDELLEEKVSIQYALANDLFSGIAISYLSNKEQLNEFEIAHLKKIYNGELFKMQNEVENNVDGTTKITEYNKPFTPTFPLTPEFNPPYEAIKNKHEIFKINPNLHSILYSKTGLKIIIPAESFVNTEEQVVKDPVYIQIQQLQTPIELTFAGVILKNKNEQFNSKFLVNINATSEKQNIHLKEGQSVKLQLPVSTDSAQIHFYDYESNSWQNLELYQQVFSSTFTPIDFYKIENDLQTAPYHLIDTSKFETRFHSGKHYWLSDELNKNQLIFKKQNYYTDLDRTWTKDYNKKGQLTGYRVKKGKVLVKIQKVIPKKRALDRQYFKIIDKTKELIIPELRVLRSINFNVKIDPTDKRAFNNDYIKNAHYYDVKINWKLGKEYCVITLKTINGFKTLEAWITDTEDLKTKKKQIRAFAKAYKKYEQVREKRANEFDALNLVRYQEFVDFENQKIKQLEKANQTTELKIQQLGSFSLLYSKEPEFSTHLIAQYTDESGLPIDVKDLYLIDKRYATTFKIEVGNLSFSPSECQFIIATDYSGQLYYASKSDFNLSSLKNNSLTYIQLKKVKSEIDTIEFFTPLTK